jgi:lipoprotein-anchoring transpeptidase ErfK/SrfK
MPRLWCAENSSNFHRRLRNGLVMGLGLIALPGAMTPVDAHSSRLTAVDIKALQQDANETLAPLGMPLLPRNGVWGPQTKRAICTKRLLTGNPATRATGELNRQNIQAFMANDTFVNPDVPEAKGKVTTGIVVNKVCQTSITTQDNAIKYVMPVSTGKKGHNTPNGFFNIVFARHGWHESTRRPSESGNGNMFNSLYYQKTSLSWIAIHGSRDMKDRVTSPTSFGCVRLRINDSMIQYAMVGGPAPNEATQDEVVSGVTHLPVAVTGEYEYHIP